MNVKNGVEIDGVDATLDAYKNFVESSRNLDIIRNSFFVGIIDETIEKSKKDLSKYHIILIVTEGRTLNLEGLKKSIIESSNYPISIVIVGISTEKSRFFDMKSLNSDGSA